jgi:CheY-like chemotaxis protein
VASLTLPLPSVQAPHLPVASRSEQPVILVVDDQDSVREVLNLALRVHGYHVRQASNGREAVELVRQLGSSVRVALVDQHMPGMTGLATIAAIRAIAPAAACCLMTGDGSFSADERAQLRGALLIWKPFNLFELLPQIRQFVGAGS